MITKIFTNVGLITLLFSVGLEQGYKVLACSDYQIGCRTGNQCVRYDDVCGNGAQCSDGSDEDPNICAFWIPIGRGHCGYDSFYRQANHRCYLVEEFCRDANYAGELDPRICQIVNSGRLYLEDDSDDTGLVLTEELVNLVQKAVNGTSKSTAPCPMFYNQVGDHCLSFFSPAKVSWPEARQFCLSIGGELLSIKEVTAYEQILNYMRDSHFTSDYWIGGRFDLDSNAWSWVHDDSAMPLGSPYWSVRHNSSCMVRSPPHTDPHAPPPASLPGGPCFNYIQSPLNRAAGWCASMTYEHYYYYTDDSCQEKRSPLCSYNGSFHQKLIITD